MTYVVNRNINYTNICLYRCGFCAFSKGRSAADLRGPPTTSISTKSRAVRSRRGSAAPLKCACRAAFIRASRATPI